MYLYKYKIRKKTVLSCKEVQTLNWLVAGILQHLQGLLCSTRLGTAVPVKLATLGIFFGILESSIVWWRCRFGGPSSIKSSLQLSVCFSGNLKCTSAAMGSLNSCGVCEALAGWTLGEWGFGPVILSRDLFAFRKEEKSCDYAFQAQHDFGHEQLLRNHVIHSSRRSLLWDVGDVIVQSFWVPPRVGAWQIFSHQLAGLWPCHLRMFH